MSANSPGSRALTLLSKNRVAFLATVAGLAGLAVGELGLTPKSASDLFPPAYAQMLQRPNGFADIVDKVKPAVVSVKVQMNAGGNTRRFNQDHPQSGTPFDDFFRRRFGEGGQLFGEQRGTPFDDFFRRFGEGQPFGQPDGDGFRHQQFRQFATAQGSGFFISADGYAVTNNHVVDGAQRVEITTDDGKTYTARVVGTDPRSDLALIKVDARNDFPFAHLADRSPRIGDWVLAVGNPFGLGGTVTAGIVSARGRNIGAGPYDDFIQIDAAVNRGNSGGPTFDMDGNVIGVNTAIFSPSGGNVGIAFDIPTDTVKSVVAQLKDKGVVARGWLGVQIQPVTADIAESLGMKGTNGALVAEPQAGSPAAKAGILSGDVITAVNGQAVKDAGDLAKQIGAMSPGSPVKLTLWRKGEEKGVSVTLGELPKDREARAAAPGSSPSGADVSKFGMTVAPAGQVAGSGSEGVVVTQVDPNGLAAEHGLKSGDVILEVGGKKVATATEVRDAIGDAQKDGKRAVLLRLKSDNVTKFVALPIAGA